MPGLSEDRQGGQACRGQGDRGPQGEIRHGCGFTIRLGCNHAPADNSGRTTTSRVGWTQGGCTGSPGEARRREVIQALWLARSRVACRSRGLGGRRNSAARGLKCYKEIRPTQSRGSLQTTVSVARHTQRVPATPHLCEVHSSHQGSAAKREERQEERRSSQRDR